jgi:hypothetical protein
MDNDTKELVQTEFLAFAMKAFAYLNKRSDLGQDKYLKVLAERLARVAAGKAKRLVVTLPPRHSRRSWVLSACRRGFWRTTPPPKSSF